MEVSDIDLNISANDTLFVPERDPIYSEVSEEEKIHLFHNLGKVGRFVRSCLQSLMFPLTSTSSYIQNILQREHWISRDLFWKAPFEDLRYPRHQQIRNYFVRYDQFVIVKIDNKEIKLKCRVIEPKDCPPEGCLNHLIIQGNISTLDNNMPGVYPFLDSYIKEREKNSDMAPARFVIFSHYDHKIADTLSQKEEDYLPGDIDEWGFVYKKAYESLVQQYGKFQLVAGHSLGTIPAIELFKHMKPEEFDTLFPQTLFFAQGPSSTYEVSKNIPFELECYPFGWAFFGIGLILHFVCKWTGWSLELDKTITEKLQAFAQDPAIQDKLKQKHLIATQVKYDFYFPGKAGLCGSDVLNPIEDTTINFYRMKFNPPLSWGVPRAQHNYSLGLLQRQDLIQEKVSWEAEGRRRMHLEDPQKIVELSRSHEFIMRHGESLADLVLRSAWKDYSMASTLENRTQVLKEPPSAA